MLRDKLFFFSSYEGYRNREGVLFRRTVPTAAMKTRGLLRLPQRGHRRRRADLRPVDAVRHQQSRHRGPTTATAARCRIACSFPATSSRPTASARSRRNTWTFPIYADPTVAGPWRTENFERNASIGGDNDQLNFRGDYNVSQNQRLIGRYTRFESTNLPVDLYGNGQRQGDPYSPEHFITTQVMAGQHLHASTRRTVLDVRFGFLRWDYDRVPGNLGINLMQTFGFPKMPYGQISERSGIPGMETIPTIAAGSNSFISTGLLYADNNTYSVTPTLTKIAGDHTLKIGANILWAEVNYFQNNIDRRHVHFQQRADGARRHQPGRHGRSVRVVPARHPDRRHVPVVGVDLRPHELPGVLRSMIPGR